MSEQQDQWRCSQCETYNSGSDRYCIICGGERPTVPVIQQPVMPEKVFQQPKNHFGSRAAGSDSSLFENSYPSYDDDGTSGESYSPVSGSEARSAVSEKTKTADGLSAGRIAVRIMLAAANIVLLIFNIKNLIEVM